MLAGCRGRGGKTTVDPTSVNPTSVTTGSTPTSGTTGGSSGTTSTTGATGTSSTTGSSSSNSTTSTTTIPVEDAITITAAKAKCEEYRTSVPSGEHQYISNEVVITKGRVVQCVNVAAYQTQLVYIADGDDMIAILTNGQSNFYKACSDYIGQTTSNYVITGKVGIYYSQPVIDITNYELKQTMTFDVDFTTYSTNSYASIESYNDYLESLDYNHKGYGVGKLVKMNSLLCIAKADNNSWLFTDSQHVQGIYHQTSNTAFTVGKVYNIIGLECLIQWKPSIRCLHFSEVSETVSVDIESLAISKTAVQMYSQGCPTDDTEKSTATNNFIKTFKYFYKSNVYINAYGQAANGYYTVAGDSYYSDLISSQVTASGNRMFLFNNASMTKYTNTKYVPVRDYICQDFTLLMYYVEYQFTKVDGRKMPQVYLFEDLVPRLSFPDVELANFFSSQTYLINEGTLPIFDEESIYSIVSVDSNSLVIKAAWVIESVYNAHVTACDGNANLTVISSTTYDHYYRHSQANPKFKYRIQFDSAKEEMTITYEHA